MAGSTNKESELSGNRIEDRATAPEATDQEALATTPEVHDGVLKATPAGQDAGGGTKQQEVDNTAVVHASVDLPSPDQSAAAISEFPTVESFYANVLSLLGESTDPDITVDGKDGMRDKIKQNLVSARKGAKDAIEVFEKWLALESPGMMQQFMRMRAGLNRPLPIIDGMDFSNREQAEKVLSENGFLPKLENYSTDEQKEEANKIFNEMREALLQWYLMLYAASLTQGVNVEEVSEDDLKAKIAGLHNEDYFRKLNEKGRVDERYMASLTQKNNESDKDYLERLEKDAVKVRDGLYVKLDENGDSLFILVNLSDENINKVIYEKRNSSGIDWTNIPGDKKTEIEALCLRAGKRVYFDGKETELSKCMSEKTMYLRIQAIRNIPTSASKPSWAKRKLLMWFVKVYVGSDAGWEERLDNLTNGIRESAPTPEDGKKACEAVFACLNENQKKLYAERLQSVLLGSQQERAKLESPEVRAQGGEQKNLKIEAARLQARLDNLLDQALMAGPKMCASIVGDSPELWRELGLRSTPEEFAEMNNKLSAEQKEALQKEGQELVGFVQPFIRQIELSSQRLDEARDEMLDIVNKAESGIDEKRHQEQSDSLSNYFTKQIELVKAQAELAGLESWKRELEWAKTQSLSDEHRREFEEKIQDADKDINGCKGNIEELRKAIQAERDEIITPVQKVVPVEPVPEPVPEVPRSGEDQEPEAEQEEPEPEPESEPEAVIEVERVIEQIQKELEEARQRELNAAGLCRAARIRGCIGVAETAPNVEQKENTSFAIINPAFREGAKDRIESINDALSPPDTELEVRQENDNSHVPTNIPD